MRTIEEVKKHLSEVVYNDAEDRTFIIGFLIGKGLLDTEDRVDIEFAEHEQCDYADFLSWWDRNNEEAVDNEVDKIISEVEELLKKKGYTFMAVNDEPSDTVCKAALDFCKEQKMMALEEFEKNEAALEESIKGLTNKKAKSIAERLLSFSKELKEEFKKTIDE